VIASNWSRNRRNFILELKIELKQLELKIEEAKEDTINSLLFSTNQFPVWRIGLKPAVVEEAPSP